MQLHSFELTLTLSDQFYLYFTVHGVEYAFGAHDYPTSGVFEVEPRQCPGFKFRKSIFIGTTSLDSTQVREFMERQSARYNGDTYHLIVKNCNHFCKDICYKLTGKSIPKWVNRLARLGIFCSTCFIQGGNLLFAVCLDGGNGEKERECKVFLQHEFGRFLQLTLQNFMFERFPSSFPSCPLQLI